MPTPAFPKTLFATLLAAFAGAASALTPGDGDPDIVLYVPGSQANDKFFAPALCSSNIHTYFQNYTSDPSKATNNDYWAIYCSTDGSKVSGIVGTKKLWISRRRLGASYVGLDALVKGTKLTYLEKPSTAACTAFSGSFTSGGTTFNYDYSCTTVTPNITATGSVSDVTPDAFRGGDNVPTGQAEIVASGIPNRNAIAGHIIGAPVTLLLRNALQYAQVLSGALPSQCAVPGSTTSANMDETAACMPSLGKQQLASLFSGAVSDWNSFSVNVSGTAISLEQVAARWASNGGSASYLKAPDDTTVHICRRENGAGQQVALLATILQNPCLGNSAPRLVQPGSFTDVQLATSLGAEDSCLTDFNNGTTNFLPTAKGNRWAIGIQTTERNVSRSANYRFIKIDGAAPTVEQVALGKYPLWSEYGIQWMNNVTADQGNLLRALVKYGQRPDNVNARNQADIHSFGTAGYVALSANGYAPDPVFNAANPVTPYTHKRAGGGIDACTVPVVNPDYGTAELR
ncbi:hypothetical protein [Methylomagnum ishizawai]|uniref:hypothetical protein n=1 Tax=Methylomagnum ishizawai TaxID=1760988 RepID=UPI001C321C67|nr:hypothetical protein [Methylomagnum ishizawai]BBL73135.1 hypothetical protein MishRS11D_02330 [Methylomagnum ishizawai]